MWPIILILVLLAGCEPSEEEMVFVGISEEGVNEFGEEYHFTEQMYFHEGELYRGIFSTVTKKENYSELCPRFYDKKSGNLQDFYTESNDGSTQKGNCEFLFLDEFPYTLDLVYEAIESGRLVEGGACDSNITCVTINPPTSS